MPKRPRPLFVWLASGNIHFDDRAPEGVHDLYERLSTTRRLHIGRAHDRGVDRRHSRGDRDSYVPGLPASRKTAEAMGFLAESGASRVLPIEYLPVLSMCPQRHRLLAGRRAHGPRRARLRGPPPAGWAATGRGSPGRSVYFSYLATAGTPRDRLRLAASATTARDFWFISRAMADLDRDGTTVLFESLQPPPAALHQQREGLGVATDNSRHCVTALGVTKSARECLRMRR